MKTLVDFSKLEFANKSFLLYKKVFNISKYTEKNIQKQLGFSLHFYNNLFFFELKKNKFYRKIIFKIFSFLLINKRFYLKMQYFFEKLQNNTMLTRINRLNRGLPVNGQRTKTNSRTSRKKYFLKYSQHLIN